MMKRTHIITAAVSAAVIAVLTVVAVFIIPAEETIEENIVSETEEPEIQEPVATRYGMPEDDFIFTYDTIRHKETLANVMYRLGFTSNDIYCLTQCPDSIFNEKKIKPGQACALLSSKDSTRRYFVY